MANIGNIIFGGRTGEIDTLVLDAIIQEDHTVENTVTQNPVEDGFDISDNINQQPEKVSINGLVSDSPIGFLQKVDGALSAISNNSIYQDLTKGEGEIKSRSQVARDKLYQISGRTIQGGRTEPQLVKIVTGLRVYTDMAMETLNIPINGQTGQALRFSATFKKVIKVKTESVAIPAPAKDEATSSRASSTTNKKKQKTITPSAEQDSWALDIAQGLKQLVGG